MGLFLQHVFSGCAFLRVNVCKEVKVYLPFLTVSFVALVQGSAPTLVLALQLGHAGIVLFYQLAGLTMVLPDQLLHLLILFPLLAHKALLLLQLLQSLRLQFWKTQTNKAKYGHVWVATPSSNLHKGLKSESYRWGRSEWCLQSLMWVSTSLTTQNKFTCLIRRHFWPVIFILFQENK